MCGSREPKKTELNMSRSSQAGAQATPRFYIRRHLGEALRAHCVTFCAQLSNMVKLRSAHRILRIRK
jgi:hypothetical protein